MIDHVSLGTTRYADAVHFYRQVLAPLGLQLLRDTGSEAAFGTPERWCFFLYPVAAGEEVTARGLHVALTAPSRLAVAAAHETALAGTAQDIFTPRLRPDISETYFGAMFQDLDGHRIEVTTNAS
ncbi:VOC family protein [Roseateles asaccharophilus]|uniref:Catechol 2,3-dioxygenase-like lactoylglutathione lyase family enzyme n=1 Tax=Roseateles asaccharophilus TaxID=582607 RepID=A0ABU2A9B6_9BURK|nr:VOC family protein [Roseateles asaccharophilus]MDR7333795.1 catechol 2,3-dioxygenase-like lactoylglutathione lyase family enzyme [Roseateles asaccharophilus]